MVKFLLERIAPVHIDTESIRYIEFLILLKCLLYAHSLIQYLHFLICSALIKQVNKSIEGTADDEDEGVPTEQAIRAGLELLKVQINSDLSHPHILYSHLH